MIKFLTGGHYPKNKCNAANEENKSTEKKASLADTQGAFIVMLVGGALSSIILLFEWLSKHSPFLKVVENKPTTSRDA